MCKHIIYICVYMYIDNCVRFPHGHRKQRGSYVRVFLVSCYDDDRSGAGT